MAEILTTITELPVHEIHVGDRLRPVSRAGVDAIKDSVAQLGVIKDKIHVRRVKRGKTTRDELMAGLHRLTAAREMFDAGDPAFETIGVVCWRCNDTFARLMEIDDNLASAELTVLDTAVFLAARKEVYEKMHPEARAATGADLVAKRWNTADMMSVVSFAAATAEKMGVSDRHVRRLLQAGEAVRGHASQLRAAPKPVQLADLMEIAKIGDISERYAVVEALEAGKAKNAKAARKQWAASQGTAPAPLSQSDQDYTRLCDAFRRAGMAARRRFVEQHEDDLRALLGGDDA